MQLNGGVKMNLKDLKSCVDQAFANTEDGNVDVEIYLEDDEDRTFEITSFGQFGFVPDVAIAIKEIK